MQVEFATAKGAKLAVWQLDGPTGRWTSVQTITVPIQYGSSSQAVLFSMAVPG
jgi:hypothetical protein